MLLNTPTQLPNVQNKILFQSEKIYTVLIVILLIWIGIIIQLLLIERKLKKIEQKYQEKR